MSAIKHITDCLPAAGYAVKEAQLLRRALKLLINKLRENGACVNCAVTASTQARLYLNLALAEKEQEVFVVMFLDGQRGLIDVAELFRGTVDEAMVHPREVVKAALATNAAAVILAHNHPSGNPQPSESDRHITYKLKAALALVDIKVIDHIVVGGKSTFSFAEADML